MRTQLVLGKSEKIGPRFEGQFTRVLAVWEGEEEREGREGTKKSLQRCDHIM